MDSAEAASFAGNARDAGLRQSGSAAPSPPDGKAKRQGGGSAAGHAHEQASGNVQAPPQALRLRAGRPARAHGPLRKAKLRSRQNSNEFK